MANIAFPSLCLLLIFIFINTNEALQIHGSFPNHRGMYPEFSDMKISDPKLRKCFNDGRMEVICIREIYVSFYNKRVTMSPQCCKVVEEFNEECSATFFARYQGILKNRCSNKNKSPPPKAKSPPKTPTPIATPPKTPTPTPTPPKNPTPAPPKTPTPTPPKIPKPTPTPPKTPTPAPPKNPTPTPTPPKNPTPPKTPTPAPPKTPTHSPSPTPPTVPTPTPATPHPKCKCQPRA